MAIDYPTHGEFSQGHCDRCGSFVGITGLWLVWKEIAYDEPLYGYDWRPFLLCRGCKDEVDPDGVEHKCTCPYRDTDGECKCHSEDVMPGEPSTLRCGDCWHHKIIPIQED